jgi:hypothetical protein
MSSAETTSRAGHIGYGIAHNRWLELANVKDISDADYRIACDGMADGWIIFSGGVGLGYSGVPVTTERGRVIYQVRDASSELTRKGQPEDAGVTDKR